MSRREGLRKAIHIVESYMPPSAADWEIRYWVVKEELVKQLKAELGRDALQKETKE